MQTYREERMRCIRLLAGDRYSDNSATKTRYINLLSLFVNIVGRSLSSQNPRVMLSTFDRAQKPSVSTAELWTNQELVRMRFADSMRRLVHDGLTNMAVAQIALADPADAAVMGWGLKAGSPFISRIDYDDLVFDQRARDFDEISFMGHRRRLPLEVVRDNPRFNKKARERLQASDHIDYNREGDERIGQISRGYHGKDEDIEDMIDLWYVYVHRHNCVKVFTEDDFSGNTSTWNGMEPIALDEFDWIGPDSGPYQVLAYEIVPGNIMPKGPLQNLVNLDELANECYRKLARQSARLKKLTLCDRQNPADGEAIQKAIDGSMVPVSDPKSVIELMTGGPDAGLFNWTREVISRFMEQGGNLTTMGGLAPQAGTLGQEQLLAQQSNGQVASMQDITASFTTRCIDSLLWFFWHNPRLVMQAKMSDPNLPDIDAMQELHPWTAPEQMRDPRTGMVQRLQRRIGEKPECKIDPYSMRSKTPQQRVKDLMAIISQVYMPMAQIFQQQGINLDAHTLMGILAKYIDAPDLQSILSIQTPPQAAGNSTSQSQGGMPAQTSREYVRRSLGGESTQAKAMEMDNDLSAAMAKSESNGQLQYS